jgi:hypothetical protein
VNLIHQIDSRFKIPAFAGMTMWNVIATLQITKTTNKKSTNFRQCFSISI